MNIPGKGLTANLNLADLSAISSRWFGCFLIAFVVVVAVYAIYYFIKGKKKV